jgi:VanZ family protein
MTNLDKVVHGGMFVALSIVWLRLRAVGKPASPASRSTPSPSIWTVILGGFAFGVLTELGQLVPIVGRDAEASDLVMDFMGVLIGVAIAPLVEPWIRSVERWLFREPATELVPAEPVARSR